MINNIRPNYINPLTMMKNNKRAKPLSLDKAEEKNQKALESEKQSIQNSLLLMKGTSGNGETSEENIKLLEKKLEEITTEIKTTKQEAKKKCQLMKNSWRKGLSFKELLIHLDKKDMKNHQVATEL